MLRTPINGYNVIAAAPNPRTRGNEYECIGYAAGTGYVRFWLSADEFATATEWASGNYFTDSDYGRNRAFESWHAAIGPLLNGTFTR